jgi:hypothetical protein
MRKQKLVLILVMLFIVQNIFAQWIKTPGIDTTSNVNSVFSSGTKLFAGTSTGVYVSTNGGQNWSLNGLSGVNIVCFYSYNNIMFAGGDALYKSSNNGENWTQVTTYPFTVKGITSSGTNLLVCGAGAYYSTNSGDTWVESPNLGAVECMTADNVTPYAGTIVTFGQVYTCRIRTSSDNGVTWTLGGFAGGGFPISIKVVNSNVYASGSSLYRSTDHGQNWNNMLSEVGIVVRCADEFSGNVIAGTRDSGVYYSNNGSSNWPKKNDGFTSIPQINGFLVYNNYIYAATSKGLWRRLTADFTSVSQISSNSPDDYILAQNYPNPFNPSTKINYEIKSSGFVTLKVFDLLGKEVATLVNEKQNAGSYAVDFNSTEFNLPSGIYFYTLNAGEFKETRKMVLVK